MRPWLNESRFSLGGTGCVEPSQRPGHLAEVDETLEVVGGGPIGGASAVRRLGVLLAPDAELSRLGVGNVLLLLPLGPPILKPDFYLLK